MGETQLLVIAEEMAKEINLLRYQILITFIPGLLTARPLLYLCGWSVVYYVPKLRIFIPT